MIITAGVLVICQPIREFYEFHTVLFSMLHYVTELAGLMSEHQFVAFIHVLKRTVQNWNNNIDAISEHDDVNNSPWYRNEMNRRKSVLFIESNNSINSKCERIHSKLTQIKQLRELHASACDITESVNAVYSPMLLLSVARPFTSHHTYSILHSREFYCAENELFL